MGSLYLVSLALLYMLSVYEAHSEKSLCSLLPSRAALPAASLE